MTVMKKGMIEDGKWCMRDDLFDLMAMGLGCFG